MIEAATLSFETLWQVIDSMSEQALCTEFDFSEDVKKKEAHWKRDKNLRDVLTHLYEWHQLLLKWITSNQDGTPASFLPEPYTWRTYGELNVEFWKKHQTTRLETAREMLKESHQTVMELMQTFSDEELFTKQYYDWTGTTTLGSYCVSALSSHYEWAVKKLRAHIRKLSRG